MAIVATNQGNNYEPIPAGTYVARCYSMIHIGTVPETFKGEIKELNKVRIAWELPTELKEFKEGEGEKPLTISKEFTLSMNEKANLRKFLEGWRGKGFTEEEATAFDITKLIGKECLLSIIHKPNQDGSKIYAVISSVSTLPKGTKAPAQVNDSFEFTFEKFDQNKFASLPDYIKDKIRLSREYQAAIDPHDTNVNAGVSTPEEENDPLPF